MKIAAHPENIEALKAQVRSGKFDNQLRDWDSVELISNSLLPKDRPSGKYKLPDGRVVEKADVSLRSRFVDYGPEDLEWLVLAGVVIELREMHFYVMKEPMFRMMFDPLPMFTMPRFITLTSV